MTGMFPPISRRWNDVPEEGQALRGCWAWAEGPHVRTLKSRRNLGARVGFYSKSGWEQLEIFICMKVFFFLSMQFDPATLKCLIFHTVRMTSQLSVLGY